MGEPTHGDAELALLLCAAGAGLIWLAPRIRAFQSRGIAAYEARYPDWMYRLLVRAVASDLNVWSWRAIGLALAVFGLAAASRAL